MRVVTVITLVDDGAGAGSPVNIATALGYTNHTASRWFAQMKLGGSGVGYVFEAMGATPAPATDPYVELSAATASAPGGEYTDVDPASPFAGGIDLSKCWVAGAHAGDKIYVSADLKV